MKYKYYTIIACYLLGIILESCSGKDKIEPILVFADSILETDDERASQLLDSIYPPVGFNKFNEAFYYLLLAQANDKNGNNTLPTDSLLDISLKYFSRNSQDLAALSLFYKARIWHRNDDTDRALKLYHEALNIFEKRKNDEYLTKTYDDLGNIYMNLILYGQAKEMFEKAWRLDSINKNKEHMYITLCNQGRLNMYENNLEKSLNYFQEAGKIARTTSDSTYYQTELYNIYGVYYSYLNDWENALKYINLYIQNTDPNEELYSAYLTKGDIFQNMNQNDSAKYYLMKSKQADELYIKTEVYYSLYKLEESKENYKEAIGHLINYQHGSDSIIAETYESENQKLIYQYNSDKEITKNANQNKIRLIIIVVIFITTLLSIIIFYVLRDRRIKLQQKKKEYEMLATQKEILQKEKEINKLEVKLNELKKIVEEFKLHQEEEDKYQQIILQKKKELYQLWSKALKSQCDDFKCKNIYKKIIELTEQEKNKETRILNYAEQDILTKEINKSFSRLIESLREAFPNLSENDLKICSLSALNLSTYEISLCFAVSSTNTIKQTKHRIKNKMSDNISSYYLYEFIFLNKYHNYIQP